MAVCWENGLVFPNTGERNMTTSNSRVGELSTHIRSRSVSIALGATFAASLASSPVALAAENPFAAVDPARGYLVAETEEGKCGEGKCGANKKKIAEAESDSSAQRP